jgi:conjugative relaxase-like TrwC/TraI family protein
MLNISKPLSSVQAQAYHKLEFTSETANYYKQDGAVQGQWQGRLAENLGLSGAVSAEEFARLTEGRHPRPTRRWFDTARQRNRETRTDRRPRR